MNHDCDFKQSKTFAFYIPTQKPCISLLDCWQHWISQHLLWDPCDHLGGWGQENGGLGQMCRCWFIPSCECAHAGQASLLIQWGTKTRDTPGRPSEQCSVMGGWEQGVQPVSWLQMTREQTAHMQHPNQMPTNGYGISEFWGIPLHGNFMPKRLNSW